MDGPCGRIGSRESEFACCSWLVQARILKTDMIVEQSMEGLCPLGQFGKVPLEDFREGIEERPEVTRAKSLVPWFSPFMENLRDLPIAARADIARTDHEIMRGFVGELCALIHLDPAVLVIPVCDDPRDGLVGQWRKVAQCIPRVLSCQLYTPTK
jgi:hypothetical protein